ncbi:cell division protein FtsZ [Candidatus Parcubacteria bacterium]|nr:cell division protein FtsZ [Candidatus Parcubacteria bacterium]
MTNLTKIKVIGVGGSGSNAVSRMMKCKIQGIDLIALNTDVQDLAKTQAHKKIRIGREATKGLGAGMNPEIGKKAAEENREEIEQILKDSDMVFITCGLGGGTGSGAGPMVAEIAKKQGALTIAVVTKPFSFEGNQRQLIAEKALENFKDRVDTLLIIPNDKILSLIDQETTLLSAFWACDEVLREAVQGISDLIVFPGIINVDFADLKAIMKNSGPALFGIGYGKGENRTEEAVNRAINSPLLDFSIHGAKGILFNVSGGKDISLDEVNDIANIITKNTNSKAKIIFGAVQDKSLAPGEIKITVIATGFNNND